MRLHLVILSKTLLHTIACSVQLHARIRKYLRNNAKCFNAFVKNHFSFLKLRVSINAALTIALFAGERVRSRASSVSQETDYVILQSNPLLHWVPVSDDANDDDTSTDSSLDSVAMSTIHRSNSQRSINSRCSIISSCSVNHYKTPPTSLLHQKSSKQVTVRRPSSLLISPPSSPRSTSRSKSTDDYNNYGSVDVLTSSKRSPKPRRSTSSLSDEMTISIPVPVTATSTSSGLSRFSRLKDRLLSSGRSQQQQHQQPGDSAQTTVPVSPPNVTEESDGESTPLVSELSSPSLSNSDSVFKGTSPDGESCDSLSPDPTIIKSQHPGTSTEMHESYIGSIGFLVRESTSSSSNGGRGLSRQNAQEWENPETPV